MVCKELDVFAAPLPNTSPYYPQRQLQYLQLVGLCSLRLAPAQAVSSLQTSLKTRQREEGAEGFLLKYLRGALARPDLSYVLDGMP